MLRVLPRLRVARASPSFSLYHAAYFCLKTATNPIPSPPPNSHQIPTPPTAFRRIKGTADHQPPDAATQASTSSDSVAPPSPSTNSSTDSSSDLHPSLAAVFDRPPTSISSFSSEGPETSINPQAPKFYEGLGYKIYQGPLARTIMTLKLVSLTSCTLSLSSVPFMMLMGDPSLSLSSRAVVSAAAVFMGVGTTVCMQYITRAYVTTIFQDAKDPDLLKVETLSMIARPKWTHMRLEETNWNVARPFISFEHKPTKKGFFVHRHLVEDHPVLKILDQPKKTDNADEKKSA